MMTRDRAIQIAVLVLALGCLVSASALVPAINQQRRALRIEGATQIGEGMPPKYALAAAAMGSFRGLAVDALWYRAEKLKQQGRYHEAKTLADLITTLQPRYAKVWSTQAWNMAYNISVGTHTPAERWDWVSKGIRLLRDEGLVYNPNSIGLYRELGWIFHHKIAGRTDDMHWHYKIELAREWQEVLGAPTEGATIDEALDSFRPIAVAAERCFPLSRPSREARQKLKQIAEADPEIATELGELAGLNLVRFHERVVELQQKLHKERRPSTAQMLEPIRDLARQQHERAARVQHDPLALLYEDAPEARPIVERVGEIGLAMNLPTLRRIGRINMILRYGDPQQVLEHADRLLDEQDQQLLTMIVDPENEAGLKALMDLLRADALINHYHMDPVKMYELMELFGPLDWRHGASHAAYWMYLGVEMEGELSDSNKIDVLNTDRNVIHAIQTLFREGRISFDPFTPGIDLLPDTRFFPAYDRAKRLAIERSKTGQWSGDGNLDMFEAGHENFLHYAVTAEYLYGNVGQARRYYRQVSELYGHKAHNIRYGTYLLTLEDFVVDQLKRDMDMPEVARIFVDAMVVEGLRRGLANGRHDIFNRYAAMAKRAHHQYQVEKDSARATTTRQRLQMAPFEEVVNETYINFMRNPAYPLRLRRRVYLNTPLELLAQTYPAFRREVVAHAEKIGLHGARAFPVPPGLADRPITPRVEPEGLPKTIERR